jgi:hypothetical protein
MYVIHSSTYIQHTPSYIHMHTVQFFAYKMTVMSENSMLKHRNVDLNTVSLKASDCTICTYIVDRIKVSAQGYH